MDEITQRLERLRREFHAFGRKSLEYVVEQGGIVDEVYRTCKEGGIHVTEWIPANLCSMSTARNYRRLWHSKDRILNVGAVTPSAAYQLLAPSVPETAADSLFATLEAGGSLSVEDVERELRPARLLEAAAIVGHDLLDQGLKPAQTVSRLRSLVELADEAAERGAVTVDGEDVCLSSLFVEAVAERTETRQQDHIASQFVVNELVTGSVTVHGRRVVIAVSDPPADLLSRDGQTVLLVWRERAKD
jgi:hypothetical protein